MKKVLSICIVMIAFSACKTGKTQETKKHSSAFESKEYQLLSIDSLGVENMNLALRVNTEKNLITGESGCNNYQFEYKLEGEDLDLGYGIATKMYCEETMVIENAFFKAASKVKHFSLEDTMLFFLDENGKVVLKANEQNRNEKKDKK